ncbi:MAG: hypothetical protein RLZZ520_213 [Bacteroidota bacterium]|jgi:hypothetical protein
MNDQQAYNFPIQFEDVHYIASLHKANKEKVNSLLEGTGLKAGLHFFGKPVVALGLIQYKVSDLGSYNEIILAIPVVRTTEKTGLKNWLDLYADFSKRKGGQYIIHIPVTTQQSVDAGRNLWGYPKILLPITHQFNKNHICTKLLDEDKQQLLQVKGGLGFGVPIPAMQLMTYSFLNNALLKTTVDVSSKMKWKIGAQLKIQVDSLKHPMGKDIRELGIENKNPIFTIESTHFKAKFNEGQQIS